MPKQIEKTQRIRDMIAKAVGDDVVVDDLAVFETIALNTLPVNKKGSLFDQAVHEESVLLQMARTLQAGDSVPLHTLHNQGGELPVGRVFYGEARRDERGVLQLHSLFYVHKQHADLVAGIDSGAIDEVSVGTRYHTLACSECGFNYMGADFENLWTQTCDNGHTIGENGVHLKVSNLDRWMELSLVSRGAANNAKILGRAKSLLGKDEFDRLAASGVDPSITTFFGSTQKEAVMAEKSEAAEAPKAAAVELSLDTFVEVKTELKLAQKDIEAKDAKIAELEAQLAEATKAANPELSAKLSAAEEALGKATTFLRLQANKLCVATSSEKFGDDVADIDALTASISDNQAKLAAIVPVGGVAKGSVEDAEMEASSKVARLSAFKSAR